jgi:hypothetical protein
LHRRQDRGFSFIYPAIVIHLPYPAVANNQYCTISDHYLAYRNLLTDGGKMSANLTTDSEFLSNRSQFLLNSFEDNLGLEYLDTTGVCHITRPNQCQTLLGNCPTPTPTPTPSPSPVIATVGFGEDYPVYRFATRTPIEDPTWTRDSPANTGNVVAYKKGTTSSNIKLTAGFTLPMAPAPEQPLSVKVRVKYNGQVIAATVNNISVSTNSFSISDLPLNSEWNSPTTVSKGNYTFNWEITLDNGEVWRDAGTTEHTIYWTYDKPVNIDIDATCQGDGMKRNCIFVNQGGERDFPHLFDLALEKAILPLNANTQTPDAIAKELAKSIDMQVTYKPNPSPNVNTDADHPLLIFGFGEAQCSGNANLLHGLLRSIGIDSETIYTWGGNPVTNPERTGGRINLYKYQKLVPYSPTPTPTPTTPTPTPTTPTPTPTPTPTHLILTNTVSFKVHRPKKNSGDEDIEKDPHFSFHATVKLNGKYYDPSYGADLYNQNPMNYPFPSIKLVETVDFPTSDFTKPKWKRDDKTIPYTTEALTLKTFCVPNPMNSFCTRPQDANASFAVTVEICTHSDRPTIQQIPNPFGFPDRSISYFDQDLAADIAVWRPSEGKWYVRRTSDETTSAVQYGISSDKLVPDDYDGDGITDYAVWRPSTGDWWILNSSNNALSAVTFGFSTDKPTVGDFDGDGKADVGVYRPETGTWYFLRSRDGFWSVQFGTAGDKPVIGDFDHDHKSDITVYRPSTGTWYILRSSDFGVTASNFGIAEDIPLPADYDGDGITDIGVYRPSTSTWHTQRSTGGYYALQLGSVGSIPVVGDYDGDQIADFATWTESGGIWTIWSSNDEEVNYTYWGTNGDIPVPSAFNR